MSKKKSNNKALRYNKEKLRLDLLPPEAELELARAYTAGSYKYADNNWRKGMEWSKCIASLKRHLLQWQAGNDIDDETKCHHLSLVAWNALTLLIYQLHNLGKDDRIKFNIDKDFNWLNKKFKLGLSLKEINSLKTKYKKGK